MSSLAHPSGSFRRAGAAAGRRRSLQEIASFVRAHYSGPAQTAVLRNAPFKPATLQTVASPQSWRRIDDDWLAVSADLAMQLDKCTNNTSLVLAFEFTDTGRVLWTPHTGPYSDQVSLRPTGGGPQRLILAAFAASCLLVDSRELGEAHRRRARGV